jgi:SAM-dependent methyltransferase
MSASLPSPYEAPDLYDLALEGFQDDFGFWLDESRRAAPAPGRPGRVLEVSCGTGRILLRLRANGIDAEGVDLSAPMLSRLEAKAKARGLAVHVYRADMRDFTTEQRYHRVFIPFNGFAHCETVEDQLRCLQCCREHLEPGGALVVDMSYPGHEYWLDVRTERILEAESPHSESGGTTRMYDTRTKDRVAQLQHSIIEIEELDERGKPTRSHRFETRQRWVYRYELELLFRLAGFSRWEILGGWDRRPLETDAGQMVGFAWKAG